MQVEGVFAPTIDIGKILILIARPINSDNDKRTVLGTQTFAPQATDTSPAPPG